MTCIFIAEQNALSIGGHYFHYTSCITSAALEAGYEVVLLKNVRNSEDWSIKGARIVPAFSRTWGEAEDGGLVEWGPGNIAYEYVMAVADAPPKATDHVLFLTVGFTELQMLLDYIMKLPPSEPQPTYHIMLRYDPNQILWRFVNYYPVFQALRSSPRLSQLVRFYADTDRLSDDYFTLTQTPFHTLPIPFDQTALRRHLSQERRSDGVLKVAYLGDARLEKNFHWIPDAVGAVLREPRLAERVRFTLQCNFNVEGGELHQLAAKQRLAQFPSRIVTLFDRPLSNEEYYGLLADADVVLLPYSPANYKARSSGILVEAMAAGKPVITTRGSWMESMMAPGAGAVVDGPSAFGLALVDVLLDIERHAAAALAEAPRMLEWSSGANFIRTLGRHLPDTSGLPKAGPHILVVMDGDAMVLRNGASCVARAQFAYLKAAGYRTTALFLTHDRSGDSKPIERFVEQLRAVVADLDIEAWFITAPGRLSLDTVGQRSARSWRPESIASDLDRSRRYDLPAELVRYLRSTRPNAVLLNYITNYGLLESLGIQDIPLICEMHDIQSFQKGIYGRRPVSSADLDLEFSLLGRCAHLISLSASETSFARERLPDVPIATTGVFSLEPPLSIATLAGCKDLSEVVSTSGPEKVECRSADARGRGLTSKLQRLAEFASIDLFYVSSNHAANVTGLRWFLETIYIPVLEPLGVTMVVAGSIAEVADWPALDKLVFLGRVQDLAPLYAAARIIVLPVTEGAGAAVKAFEAMRFGRPIVSTGLGVRGLDAVPEGVEVANEPHAFVEAILRLLESDEARTAHGARILHSTRSLVDPDRYRLEMDSVFRTVLKEKALPSASLARPPEAQIYPEWNSVLQTVNKIVRDLISGDEIDFADILAARAAPPEQVNAIAAEVMRALLVDRNAPILRTEERVLDVIRRIPAKDAATVENGVSLLRGVVAEAASIDSLDLANARHVPVSFCSRAMWETRVAAVMASHGALRLGGAEAVDYQVGHGRRVLLARAPAQSAETFHYRILAASTDLAAPDPDLAFVLRQKVDATELVAPADKRTGPSGADPSVVLRKSTRVAFRLPNIGSNIENELFLDLEFFGDVAQAELSAAIGGHPVPVDLSVRGQSTHARIRLSPESRRVPLNGIMVEMTLVEAPSGRAALLVVGAVLSVVVGRNAMAALTAVEMAEATSADPAALPEYAQDALLRLLARMAAGMPLGPDALQFVRAHASAHPDWLESALARLVPEASAKPAEARITVTLAALEALLFPGKIVKVDGSPQALPLVASPALTIEIAATFADAIDTSGVRCLLGGEPARRLDVENGRVVWVRDGMQAFDYGDWLTRITFVDSSGEFIMPATCSASINLPAITDMSGTRKAIKAFNFYDVEESNGAISHTWIGPGRTGACVVPVMTSLGAQIVLSVVNFGANKEPDDVHISVNGHGVRTEVQRNGEGGSILCEVAADKPPTTDVYCAVTTRKQVVPGNGDTRRLGIAIGHLHLTWPLLSR